MLLSLREQGIKSLERVDYALLEANGKLSVFLKKRGDNDYPMAIIVDGEVQKHTLNALKKDEKWLINMLKEHNLTKEEIFYCFYNKYKLFVITNDDIKKWEKSKKSLIIIV